jgi:hypothetical protein
MTVGQIIAGILLGLSAGVVALGHVVRERHDGNGRRVTVMRAVAAGTGLCSLALSREGGGTRDHTEGPYGCLGDMPAGYCLRERCDVMACPDLPGKSFQVEIVRAAR